MNNRYVFVLISIMIFTFSSYSQEEKKDSQFSFSAAFALPVSDFKNDNLYDNSAGLATNGICIKATRTFSSKSNLHLEISFNATMNPLNKNIDNELLKENSYSYPYEYDYSYGDWISTSLLAGPAIINEFNKIGVSLSLKGGLMYASKPYIDQRLYLNDALINETLNEKTNGYALAIDAELSFYFKVGQNTSIRLFGGYYFGKPEFPVKITQVVSGYKTESNVKYPIKISTINIGAGILFHSKVK